MAAGGRKFAPLLLLLALLAGLTASVGQAAYHAAGDHLIYALDDPYIHMAIAKHLIRDGSWSVTGQGFTSSSSSPLWTLLVSAGQAVFGMQEWWPLALNAAAAAALACVAYWVLLRSGLSPRWAAVGSAVAILLGPVVPVMFTGLEHVLHAALVLAAVYLAAELLDPLPRGLERPGSDRRPTDFGEPQGRAAQRRLALVVVCALAVMTRYESLFLIFVLCLLFLLRRQIRFAVALGVVSVLPMVVAGLISISHGWYFLPNSVLIKGRHVSFSSMRSAVESLGGYGLWTLAQAPHLTVLLLVAVAALIVLVRRQGTIWRRPTIMLLIFIAVTLLHAQFAAMGWFYRYECYLVVLGCVALVAAAGPAAGTLVRKAFATGPVWRRFGAAVLAAWLLFFPAQRAAMALYETPKASRNIYEQQYQMGLFFRQFYNGQKIALNDIGAVNFLSDAKCLDLYGLANLDVMKIQMRPTYEPREMEEVVQRFAPRLIAIYSADFGRPPANYIPVAHWLIRDNIICGGSIVDFYAIDMDQALAAQQQMRQFAFPDRVDVGLEPLRR